MTVSLIVAVAKNGVIGNNNKLPWHLPADLKRFKQITMGHPIIMGRKTFESIGKPLPGRTTIVVTSRKNYPCCGVLVANSLQEALEMVARSKRADHGEADEAFVIGGASIYEQALPLADRIYLTEIHQDFEGDACFNFDRSGWKETASEEGTSETNLPYRFVTLEKH